LTYEHAGKIETQQKAEFGGGASQNSISTTGGGLARSALRNDP
jgi:hypothetical protein